MSEDDNHEEEPRRRHLLSSRSHSGQSIRSSDVPLLFSPLSGPVADDRERSINPHVLGPDVRTYGRASHGSREMNDAFLIVFSVVVGRRSDRPGRGDIGDGG